MLRPCGIGGVEPISTHTPHAGSDPPMPQLSMQYSTFQLTLPMRGAIISKVPVDFVIEFQLTLPMRGAIFFFCCCNDSGIFQLTLPMRGAMCIRNGTPNGSR